MERFELPALKAGESRVRHCDGPEGTFIGWKRPGGDMLWLIVTDGGRERVWAADDCEVIW